MTKFEHIKYQIRARNHFHLCFTILLFPLSFFLFGAFFRALIARVVGDRFRIRLDQVGSFLFPIHLHVFLLNFIL
jgi:hypothetical protein